MHDGDGLNGSFHIVQFAIVKRGLCLSAEYYCEQGEGCKNSIHLFRFIYGGKYKKKV